MAGENGDASLQPPPEPLSLPPLKNIGSGGSSDVIVVMSSCHHNSFQWGQVFAKQVFEKLPQGAKKLGLPLPQPFHFLPHFLFCSIPLFPFDSREWKEVLLRQTDKDKELTKTLCVTTAMTDFMDGPDLPVFWYPLCGSEKLNWEGLHFHRMVVMVNRNSQCVNDRFPALLLKTQNCHSESRSGYHLCIFTYPVTKMAYLFF